MRSAMSVKVHDTKGMSFSLGLGTFRNVDSSSKHRKEKLLAKSMRISYIFGLDLRAWRPMSLLSIYQELN